MLTDTVKTAVSPEARALSGSKTVFANNGFSINRYKKKTLTSLYLPAEGSLTFFLLVYLREPYFPVFNSIYKLFSNGLQTYPWAYFLNVLLKS